MISDPIVEEIRKYRAEYAAEHQNDLQKIFEALKEREAQSEKPIISRGPRLLLKSTGS